MSDIIASPSTRRRALEKGVDLEARAKALGRTTIGKEDLDGSAAPAATGDTSYWDVDHAAYGPVTEEPMGRFAQVAAKNLARGTHAGQRGFLARTRRGRELTPIAAERFGFDINVGSDALFESE